MKFQLIQDERLINKCEHCGSMKRIDEVCCVGSLIAEREQEQEQTPANDELGWFFN